MLYGKTQFNLELELKRILGFKIFRTVLCNLRLQVFGQASIYHYADRSSAQPD